MILEQYELGCLSQLSYLIGDEGTGRAIVVDPKRDIDEYLADAERLGLTIERVIETHVHADFVSGHLELAANTGAAVSFGEAAQVDFPIEPLRDGQVLSLGDVALEVRATPGHTPESICLVVREGGRPVAALTGDTLFIGDVGRPDLLAAAGAATSPDAMARQLHRSLREQLLTLPDDVRVYPAHGAGSACGKELSTETWSTIGEQRRTNYALAPMSDEEFVLAVTEGQVEPPPYFAHDAAVNRSAHALAAGKAPPALSLDDVLARQREGAVVLDTRAAGEFAAGHLAGAVNVGLDGRFAEYAGDVLTANRPIILVTDPDREVEAQVRLARIGFDNVVGALAGAMTTLAARPDVVARSSRLTAVELAERRAGPDRDRWPQLVDVRNPGEVAATGTVDGALPLPLARLAAGMRGLDRDRPVIVYCAGGYRSSIAASVLSAAGFADVSDVIGGFEAIRAVS